MKKNSLYVKANIALASLGIKKVPLRVKLLILLLIAYIVSPIDLIPDFIPVLGLLDEVVLVPIALTFITRLIPKEIYEELQQKQQEPFVTKKLLGLGALLVISIWCVFIFIIYSFWQLII